MKKSSEVIVNSKVLTALRETSRYTIEEVAKKAKCQCKKVDTTGKGFASFTLTQIKKLASIYHRSLAAFSLILFPQYRKFRRIS